ncbi:MBL fold metallo-hydrolase [Amycolatopsis acidicola]|uniref:MBL fold metallo-hydrolase n=1 Tax=Amycolatopsis acidicola TaxID=2596893 RepID=A0A5N0V1T3_9PSEU|nr:MBL fold metallo-hydrolase [Amycolatopsis acidicola]KAA9159650.1 MBL fold metallo-hydrolase [Amycolatopsis acidicola]
MTGWFDLGDVAVVPVIENERLLIDPAEFFPGRAGGFDGWAFEKPWCDNGKLVYTIQAFLVVTPDEVVLVDACVGDGKKRARPEFDRQDSGWWERLARTGISADEVSTVVFTHLHVDHVGWATRWERGGWRPAFPRARHVLTEPEYRYWTSPAGAAAMRRTGDYLTDSIEPVRDAGLLDLVPADAAIGRHLRLRPAPGHTPGNSCVLVSGSRGRILLTGDTLHHPLQLADPGVSSSYCTDPAQSARTRRETLEWLADTGVVMLPAHFAAPSAGRVVRAGGGFGFAWAGDVRRGGEFGLASVRGRGSG